MDPEKTLQSWNPILDTPFRAWKARWRICWDDQGNQDDVALEELVGFFGEEAFGI